MNELESKYDQYFDYDSLPKLLKRFSFSEKMRICAGFSQKYAECEYKHNLIDKKGLPLPWTLETFLMLAIEAKEYANNDFQGKNENKFIKIANTIWSYVPESLEKHKNIDFINYFLPLTAITQFSIQEYPWIKFYRFWKLFGDNSEPVRLQDVFKEKFRADYYDFVIVIYFLQLVFTFKSTIPQEALLYLLCEKYPNVRKALTISREDYIKMQQSLISSPKEKSEYIYSVRPSYQYSFVEYGGTTYIPLPHLLTKNITTSFLYRLTEKNNALRQSIGKHNLEAYLLGIIRASKVYDEVFDEQEYTADNGCKSMSPDILARYKNSVLFLDSKSTVPSSSIRLIDNTVVSSTLIRTLIENGEIEKANEYLGHPHMLSDTVRSGYHLGTKMGTPTINMKFPEGVIIPRHGVYAAKVVLDDGSEHVSVTNVGVRPTVSDDNSVSVESFILDFNGNLYDRQARVEFYSFLRDEKKFASTEELSEQIKKDAQKAREYFDK